MNGKKTFTRVDCPAYHAAMMEGPAPPNDYATNGCGGSRFDFVPDSIGPIQLLTPCVWHDWHYQLGGGKRQRLNADCFFYRNLKRVGLPNLLALLYFFEVRLWGHSHFLWTSEKKPRFLKAFFESFFNRFIEF